MTLNTNSTLQLRSDFNATFTPLSITDGTTLNFDVNNNASAVTGKTLTLSGSLAINAATINVTGANGYTLALGAVSGPGPTFNPTTANLSVASITLSGNTSTLNFTGQGNTTVAGNILTAPGKTDPVTFNQTGTVTLDGAETVNISGSFANKVNSGTAVLNNNSAFLAAVALGNASSSSTAAATLLLGGTDSAGLTGGITLNQNITAEDTTSGTLTIGGQNTSGANTVSGTLTLGATSNTGKNVTLVSATGGEVDFTNTISRNGTATTGGITVGDASGNYNGTVKLMKASNTYVGGTTISSGTLALAPSSGTNNISASKYINVGSGAGLNVTAVNGTTNNSFALAGTGTQSGSQVLGGSGMVTGTVTVASGATLSAGTTAGIANVPATGSSNIIGTLSTASLNFNSGGNLAIKVSDGQPTGTAFTAGTDFDTIAAPAGALTVTSGFNVELLADGTGTGSKSVNFDPTATYTFQIASFASSSGITGSGSGDTVFLTSGTAQAASPGVSGLFTLDTSNFVAANPGTSAGSFYLEEIGGGSGGGSLDVVYNSAPEPGTAMLFLGGAMPMLIGRRRCRKVANPE